MSTSTEPLPLQYETPPTQINERGKWLVLLAAFLGWMFDGLEMGIFPQIANASLSQLVAGADQKAVNSWHAVIDAAFLLGAAAGGLAFGWLGDRIGRVRAMAFAILVYSGFTGLLFFVTAAWQIAALRFIAALGMGGEWALGVALVMEVWSAKHRPLLAGLIGAAANVGFVLVGLMGAIIKVGPTNWRWFAILGAAPALLTFVIRLFVPESHKWQASQQVKKSKPITEILADRRLAVTALIAIGLASVALLGTWGAVQKIPGWVRYLPGNTPASVGNVQMASGLGAIVGCLVAPLIAAYLNRRVAYVILCVGSLAACQLLFRGFDRYNSMFLLATFIVGGVTAALYGWLPLYLPELFPTRVRATAQGIAFNFGRIFAAGGNLVFAAYKVDYAIMGQVVSLIYLAGVVLIWFSPETKGKPLPE